MTLYRIPDSVTHTHTPESPLGLAMCLRCMLDMHIADGQLVPVEPDYDAAVDKAEDIYQTGNVTASMADDIRCIVDAAFVEGTT